MEELFKIEKDNIEFSVFKDEKYPEVGLLNLQGALIDKTLDGFRNVIKKIDEDGICDLVIDFSGLKSISEDGWEAIYDYFNEFDRENRKFVITRMRPFIYDRFKNKNYDETIPHYRTYNKALNHIIPEEEKRSSDESSIYDNIDAKNDFEADSNNQQNKEFPLEESRELNEELQKNEVDEEFEFEDENEVLSEMHQNKHFENEESIDHIKEYEDNLKSFIIKKIFEWKDRGFDVSKLEEMLKNNFEKLKNKFGLFAKRINDIEQIVNHIENIDNYGLEKKIDKIKQNALNLEKYEEVKKEYSDLLNKIDKQNKKYQKPVIDYTFDNFIKGSCNSDSFDMSKHIINKIEKFRRPIYIFGPNGSGKTHLLNAIGNKIRQQEEKSLFYINGNSFKILLNKFQKRDSLDDFRNQLLNNDVILIDDLHKISDSNSALFEFRIIYDSIKKEGLKLFATSVNKPDKIDNISPDLKSRLNDSIFLRLSNIDRDTFHNIIKIQFEEEGVEFNNEILELLYAKSDGDIRKAYGFVNTLKTFYEAKNEKITLEKTKNILGFKDEVHTALKEEDIREFTEEYNIQEEKQKTKNSEDYESEKISEEEDEKIKIEEETDVEEFEEGDYELDEKETVFEDKFEKLDEIKDNLNEDIENIKDKKEVLDEEFEEIEKQIDENVEEQMNDEKIEDEKEKQEETNDISISSETELEKEQGKEDISDLEEEKENISEDIPEEEITEINEENEIEIDEAINTKEKIESGAETQEEVKSDYKTGKQEEKKEKEHKNIDEKENDNDDTISYGLDENFDKKKKSKEEKEKKEDIFEDDDYDFDDDLFNVDEEDLDWEDEELDEEDEDDDFFS